MAVMKLMRTRNEHRYRRTDLKYEDLHICDESHHVREEADAVDLNRPFVVELRSPDDNHCGADGND
jgi:hypothetical protein